MKLLLDTHILVWSVADPSQLTPAVAAALEDPANEIWLSPITAWELLLLVEKGRLALDGAPAAWLRSLLRRGPFREAPITHEVALRSRTVDLPHQDPADRFLAATASVCGLTLVTADERLLHSTQYPALANRLGAP